MSQLPFVCPKCGSDHLRVSTTTPTIEDFYKAHCAGCNAPMSEEEIKKQARKIAADAIQKALKR